MPKAVTIGNGNMLAGLDDRGALRDLYFPYVGQENHISGASGTYKHRIGVWVGGTLRWLDDESWKVTVGCSNETAASEIKARNDELGVSLFITDVVYNERNIFIRNIRVTNDRNTSQKIKIFFAQQFRISESSRGGTGFYDPRVHAIIHYKGKRTFLINAEIDGQMFDDFSIGLFGIENKEGTHTDAEDGELSKNPIEHGSVDSVIGLTFNAGPRTSAVINYWIAAGETIDDVHELDSYVRDETAEHILKSTQDYWHAWVNKGNFSFHGLTEDTIRLFKRSLLIIRAHTDNRGAIIASSDSDILQNGRDTYSYMWPRDGAITAHSLDKAGYLDPARRFFAFVNKLLTKDGYLMHKYLPDGSLGSSWHPWMYKGRPELPIQEDETAVALYMLGYHYEAAKDLEFIESIYNSFIKQAANFLCIYIHKETGLPKETYDLWEEKYGSSTYTSAAVCGALRVAANFAILLGKRKDATRYRKVAKRMSDGILKYLYDEKLGMFVKLVRHEKDKLIYDKTIDISSFHGVVFFDILPPSDRRVKRSLQTVQEKLRVNTEIGGMMRYEGDSYYRVTQDSPPNPWFITSLWMAQYYIKAAKKPRDLEIVKEWFDWVCMYASKTHTLPEQLDSYTGAHLSAEPLTWSHAEFIITVIDYLKKIEDFGIAKLHKD